VALRSNSLLSPKRLCLVVLLLTAFLTVTSVTNLEAQPRGANDAAPGNKAILREIVAARRLANLRWPNFSDYSAQVKSFYEPSDYALAWLHNNEPTQQAQTLIEILQQADNKGLNAEDYDGPRWPARLARFRQSSPSPDEQARFDVSLTVCVMRYVSDLHIGRINPRRFNFKLDVGPKKYDLALFLREKLINSVTVQAQLDGVEPPFAGYKRTQKALQHYLELVRQDDGEQLPLSAKPIESGNAYIGTPRLVRLLRLLGDLPPDAAPATGSNLYGDALVEAIKHFQRRHGLSPDGRLGQETLKQLNTPLSFRVQQLRLTLERWRWVPHQFPQPPIVVNIPEFRLRAYDTNGKIGLVTSVIVGKAYRHRTPVFERNMRFIVFRPYWNVPPSIHRSEIVPAIQKDRSYVAKKGYEVTTREGAVVTAGVITEDVLQQLGAGKLLVRQKPGPSNALGLVKLMFPNEYNVYLHSTPTQKLFSQSRRDFSHGCIRVEQAAELAAWVLRDKPEWTLERVRAAMESRKDDVQINLSKPVPVLILYGTAVVDEENQVHFFNDIYGHDAALEKVLSQGYPYPG
jgi:L,D-transpeptidase YcbB